MERPALPLVDVVNSRSSPVKNQPARRISISAVFAAAFISIANFGSSVVLKAQSPTMEAAVERLARKAAALPHERRMSLIWSNHAGISEQKAEQLRAIFAAKLESVQVRFAEGEAAPALRVSIEQTPTRFVFAAIVPGEGGTNVAIEEVSRLLAGSDQPVKSSLRLQKELVWQQEARILSAALPRVADDAAKRMVVLTEDALLEYSEEQGNWKIRETKALPQPRQAPRGARGQLLFADDGLERVGILLPGRRCEANLSDQSPVACTASNVEWPAGRLLAFPACGAQTWWLKSDTTDWTVEDRLLLRASVAGKDLAPVAEVNVPGPVQAISAGSDAASAGVVVRNVSTGNYEVYRVALSCAN